MSQHNPENKECPRYPCGQHPLGKVCLGCERGYACTCRPTNQETPEHNPPCRYGELDGFQGAVYPCSCTQLGGVGEHEDVTTNNFQEISSTLAVETPANKLAVGVRVPCVGACGCQTRHEETPEPTQEKLTMTTDNLAIGMKRLKDNINGTPTATPDEKKCNECGRTSRVAVLEPCPFCAPEQKDFVEEWGELTWEEEFDDLYEDLDYPVCCDGRECACNAESYRDNIKRFIRKVESTAYAQGEQAERERIWRDASEKWADKCELTLSDLKAIIHSTDKP